MFCCTGLLYPSPWRMCAKIPFDYESLSWFHFAFKKNLMWCTSSGLWYFLNGFLLLLLLSEYFFIPIKALVFKWYFGPMLTVYPVFLHSFLGMSFYLLPSDFLHTFILGFLLYTTQRQHSFLGFSLRIYLSLSKLNLLKWLLIPLDYFLF